MSADLVMSDVSEGMELPVLEKGVKPVTVRKRRPSSMQTYLRKSMASAGVW